MVYHNDSSRWFAVSSPPTLFAVPVCFGFMGGVAKKTKLLLLIGVSDWSIIMIRPGGLLLVVSYPIFAVPVCFGFMDGVAKKKSK